MTAKPAFLAIDVETSGLDPASAMLLEIALVALDGDLNELGSFSAVILPTDFFAVGVNSDPEALAMHERNGLLLDVMGKAASIDDVARAIEARCRSYGIDLGAKHSIRMVGNNPWFDRAFVKRFLPGLDHALHYRMVDVSTLRTVTALCAGATENVTRDAARGHADGKHRALDDARDCAAEFRAYASGIAMGVAASEAALAAGRAA